ncbi:MAG: adenylosuccinate synthase, partial [candidate division Zixibacteria bacterium]|nr:adenylosuccinate synthase [candidate division Zixibacteria bacterium]
LTEKADIIARPQGGANAGHTVVIGDNLFILHLIPTGILHPHKICIIGNGMVIDLEQLFFGIADLKKRGIDIKNRLFISENAHLVMPYHKAIERLEEESKGKNKVGTTGKGIGPAYRDKIGRCGIRLRDILYPEVFKKKVESNLKNNSHLFGKLKRSEFSSLKTESEAILKYKKQVVSLMADVSLILNEAVRNGKSVLFEGAQGTMLDVDHGTYPYCTSSNVSAGGACTGTGVGPTLMDEVIGVVKAYTTRVGNGPFPTEFDDGLCEAIREKGKEFGATTGRPRRCGWLDLVLLKYSVRVNGITKIALTKLDVLDDLGKIKVCMAYKYKGKTIENFTNDLEILENCTPVYKEIDGWETSTHGMTKYQDLPRKAKDYINFISKQLGVEVMLISTGCKRDEPILI